MSLILFTISTIAATFVSAWLDYKGRIANEKEIKQIRDYIYKRIGEIK